MLLLITVVLLHADYATDVFFLVDIVLNLYVFAYDEEGVVIKDRQRISFNYKHTWYNWDMMATIPIDLIM